jgi:hypothetical protein
MANNLLTTQQITREAIRLFRNSNAFLKNIDRQYDGQYARDGAKIGSTLRIRLPNDYVVRSGPTAVPQDTVEQTVPLTISNQKGVDVAFSSADRSLSLDDFSTRVLAPMMNSLGGVIAADIMSLAETVPSVSRNADATTNATLSPNLATFLDAGAHLDNFGVLRGPGQRNIVFSPETQARTVSALSGLFNNQQKVGEQYRTGTMTNDAIGFDYMMDQTTIIHTTGAYGTLPTVNGANQSGSAITVSAVGGTGFKKGDYVRFAGVFRVNRVTKQSTGRLMTFVLTADVPAGSTSLPIYPALIPAVGGVAVPYQTVDVSPANGAAVTSPFNAGEAYRKNVAMGKQAFTMATADLDLPRGVHEAARENFDGVSMRMVSAYNVISDQFITRFDVLYGFGALRPEFATVIADAI